MPVPEIMLPIGISFFTFQAISYVVDVYRGKVKAQENPLRLLLYVSCFPQLVAGPIVQYGDVAEAIGRRETTMEDFTLGVKRFAAGLGKKVLLANLCGAAVEAAPLAMVDFWADWCGPCKMVGPTVEKIAADYDGKALVAKVNIDREPELAQRFGVMSIPTMVFFKKGEELDRKIGVMPEGAYTAVLDGNL